MVNSHVFVGWLVAAVLLAHCQGCSLLENQPFYPNEEALVAGISSWRPSPEEALQCLRTSLNKGLYELAETIAALGTSSSQTYHSIYDEEVKRLTQFSRQLITGITTISPVIKWAQNNESVLVAFKLSHRWDSPPCTTTKHQSYTFENNTLDYTNDCVVSRQKIHFKIQLTLWQDVDKEGLEIKRDGVGTYLMTIKKKSPAIWLYLDQTKTRHLIWGDISERPEYSEHMSTYSKMIEAEMAAQRARAAKSTIWLGVTALLFMICIL